MTEQCSEDVYRGSILLSGRCARRGVIQRDGKWYCRQHDPEAVSARRKESYQRHQAGLKRRYWRGRAMQRILDSRFAIEATSPEAWAIIQAIVDEEKPKAMLAAAKEG